VTDERTPGSEESLPPPPTHGQVTNGRSVGLGMLGAAVVIALLAGIGIGYAAGSTPAEDVTTGQPVTPPDSSSASPSSVESPSPIPSPTTAGDLTRTDVELTLKTTEKQCFGSAGCSVTVGVRAAVDQAVIDSLPADGTWDVTYQITGDESGPIIGTFSLYGNGKYDVNEEFLSTRSSNTPIRVNVTDVERF
jgi:hypothetical protein